MLIMVSVIVFLTLILLLPFFIVQYTTQKEVLKLFLEIPIPKIGQLLKKCEQYIISTQSGNEDEIMSEKGSDGNFNLTEEEELGLVGYRTKKRKYFF